MHQREVRDFASALVHNRLGALTIQPGNSIMGNAVIELTIHLAAVLLTGNNHLLMPLKQLGLSPENMQVNVSNICLSKPFQLSNHQLLSVSNDKRLEVLQLQGALHCIVMGVFPNFSGFFWGV